MGQEWRSRNSDAGAKVVVNYARSAKGAEETVSKIAALGGEAIAVQADISQEEQVKAMFLQAIATYGTVDILVSNAGLQQDFSLVEMSLEAWNKVIGINLTGQFLCAREAVKEFMRRGIVLERSCAMGKIICMSSVHETNYTLG